VGIAAAISKGAVGKRGKPVFGFPRFSIRPVISTALRGLALRGGDHALRLAIAESSCLLARCISMADSVSDCT